MVALSLLAGPARAQRDPGAVTVGPQVGTPGGVTTKVYRDDGVAYESVLTTDVDDYGRLSLHRLWERPLPDSLVYVYYGPGIGLGGQDLDTGLTPEVELSIKVGFNFYAERFEVFLHATPVLRLRPNLTPRFGTSVGLRYDLSQPN